MVILDADSTTSELWEDTKLLFSNAAAICTTQPYKENQGIVYSFHYVAVTAEENTNR